MQRAGGGPDDAEAALILGRPGDPAVLEWLYRRHAPYVFGYLRRVVDDRAAAEDILQDVFIQLWRSLAAYDPARGPVRPWLMSMARSRAIDHLRRRQIERRGAVDDADGLDDARAATDAVGDDEHVARAVVRDAVRSLSREQRRALYLVYFLGLTHREAARRLVVPVGTLKGRLRLSVDHLRRWLEIGSREG